MDMRGGGGGYGWVQEGFVVGGGYFGAEGEDGGDGDVSGVGF